VIFAAAWCFYWGWFPVWSWFRRQGFWIAGSWIVILIVIGLAFEVLVFVAVANGLFTGIQKYRKNKRLIALVNRGWLNEFPGKYVPEIGYIPGA